MPIISLATRFLSDRLKGLGAWGLAAFWWLLEWAGDKLLGDAAFSWLRDMVSPLTQYAWIALLWTYGIPLGLIGLGAYFFWRAGGAPMRAARAAAIPQNAALQSRASAPEPTTNSDTVSPDQAAPTTKQFSVVEGKSRADGLPVLARPKSSPVIAAASLPDVPDWDWGKLYSRSQEGNLIHLRFLPDTAEEANHTILLIVYGYKALMDQSSIKVGIVHNEVRRARRDAPNARGAHKMQGIHEVVAIFQEIDYGKTPIETGYLRRVRLSEGGAYELTQHGLHVARNIARDLIERA